MASPLRSWSPFRFGRAAGAGWSSDARRQARRPRARVEPLEDRQLLAASLVSIDSTGLTGGNNTSQDSDISSTGRFVVFTSRANNLTTNDANATFDVYLRDLQTGVTQLVSVNSSGTGAGNANSTDPSVNSNGRYVAFTSDANNLVAGDNNGKSDVFVRDMFTNTTKLASINVLGTGPANGDSLHPAVSDDGKFVAFASDATNVASNDASPTRDVFLRNLESNTTTLISRALVSTVGGNGPSQSPAISLRLNDDETQSVFVAFISEATDLEGGGGAAGADVYRRDFDAATTKLISSTNGATGGSVDPAAGPPALSSSGRYVAFASTAADLVAGDINGLADVFRADSATGVIDLVSQNTAGVFSNGASSRPRISGDGRYVSFTSTASNLALPDAAAGSDVFIRDIDGTATFLASANLAGDGGSGAATEPAMSDDAKTITFTSTSANLVTESATGSQVYVVSTPLPDADVTRPTFRVPTQPSVPAVGNNVLPFTVIFEDNAFVDAGTLGNTDVVVTGPNGFSETATLFALVSTTGTSATVAYTVPAPGGTLSSEDNGTYVVTVRGSEVGDASRNFVATASTGTFVLALPTTETVLPVPTFSGGSPNVGTSTYEFNVTYSERGGIDFATFGNDDVRITGPNGFSQNATFIASTPLSPTTNAVVYRITAPGGVWDAPDSGQYTVSILAGGVVDLGGNAVAAGPIGTFTALGPDLIAIPLRNLRSGAISGVDVQRAKIRVLNQGTFPTTVPVAVTLYASLDQTLDPGDATIGTFIEERPIRADDFREIKARFTYPTVVAGDYFILSQVDSANAVVEQFENNNVAASFKKVGLSAPFVDLVPTLLPFTGIRSRLGTNEVTIRIKNAGNVTTAGDILVALSATSDVTPAPGERPVASVPIKISLKPGQTKTFRLPFGFPIEFERGNYKMVATIDSGNVIPERDEANNRVVSFSEFQFV